MNGDKEVVIDENSNIHVDGEEYKGKPGNVVKSQRLHK